MKTKYLTSLLFLVVACSGAQTTGGEDNGGKTTTELKKAAAEAKASGNDQGDVCGAEGWYGDGQCDTFCQDADSVDCVPDPGGVHCAEFLEQPNGFCSRVPSDPCIGQDPDCSPGTIEPSKPGDPNGAINCTLIAQLPDGVCRPDPADACVFYQDPDCSSSSGDDGSGNSGSGGGTTPSPGKPAEPTDPSTPVCEAVPEAADGVCSRKPSDPCLALDPDCVPDVACAEYIELPDGVCKRDPADPCIFQDPDCQ
jgi:hypothetical protein